MASQSFNDFIQAGRATKKERRDDEQRAKQIFGKKSNPLKRDRPTATEGPSLASRMGVGKTKRTSTPSPGARSGRPPRELNPRFAQQIRAQVENIEQLRSPAIVLPPAPTMQAAAAPLSFRGHAGPCLVIASNFAPGTTAADITSAISSMGADLLNCQLTSVRPVIAAELLFSSRPEAERIVEALNDQKADGKILKLYISESVKNIRATPNDLGRSTAPLTGGGSGRVAEVDTISGTRLPRGRAERAGRTSYREDNLGEAGGAERDDGMEIEPEQPYEDFVELDRAPKEEAPAARTQRDETNRISRDVARNGYGRGGSYSTYDDRRSDYRTREPNAGQRYATGNRDNYRLSGPDQNKYQGRDQQSSGRYDRDYRDRRY